MADSRRARLGELVDRYQNQRARDPSFRLADMRAEAGDLYDELTELVQGLGAIETCFADDLPDDREEPDPPPPRRLWMLALVGVAAALATAIGLRGGVANSASELVAYPPAVVFADGQQVGETPWRGNSGRTVTLRRKGFKDRSVRLDSSRTVHLEPISPFGPATLRTLGHAYGTMARMPRAPPARVRGDARVSVDALRVGDSDAFARELARYPEVVRDRAYIRVLAIANLIAGQLHAEAYAAAVDLAKDDAARHSALRLQLEALWGLDVVETGLYREVFARWNASRP